MAEDVGSEPELNEHRRDQLGDRSGQEAVEELPTMPPTPRGGQALRWAVPEPLSRPDGQGALGPVVWPPPGWPAPAPAQPPAGRVTTGHATTGPATRGPATTGAVVAAVLGPSPRAPETSPGAIVGPPPSGAPTAGKRRGPRAAALALGIAVLVGGGSFALDRALAPPGQTPAAQFEALMVTSAGAHTLVAQAVDGACGEAAPEQAGRQAELDRLGRAVSIRQAVMRHIAGDTALAGQLAHGRLLLADLASVTEASLRADRDYQYWLHDLQATGCYSAPANNLNYEAAILAAGVAGQATERLASTWAPVAQRFGLPVKIATET